MFTVDGVTWSIPCDIKRTSEITSSEISGLLLNKKYYNDVIGTYLKYDVKLVANPNEMADYYAIYEIITQPVGEHTFILPYNGSTVTVVGRVENISDVYRVFGGVPYWSGTSFSVISNTPKE